ncbi:MAG: alpha/beta fold hydrolase [Chloroflexota bacterium]
MLPYAQQSIPEGEQIARYTEELVYVETSDRLVLEGAVIRPASQARTTALIWIHGLTGKFYAPSSVLTGRVLAERGYAMITGNNRGHDFGTMIRDTGGKAVLAGGGWERFDESPRDVLAWIDCAERLGFKRVVLLGHSLGGLKVVYFQAKHQDARVAGLVAASPPLRAGHSDPALLAQAEMMVAEGRGNDLLPWGTSPAGAGTHSAQTYLNRVRSNIDVYGHDTPDPPVAQIRCPILAIYGTNEAWVGSAPDLDVIERNATSAPRVQKTMIEGADHIYTDKQPELAKILADWMDTLG